MPSLDFTKLGGRRFILSLGAGVVTSALQWFGKLDPAGTTYAMVIGATVAAYITGGTLDNKNGVERYQPKP